MTKKQEKAQAVEVVTPTIPENSPAMVNPETMISLAIEKGAPIETIERMMKLRSELKAEYARDQFNMAMAELQKNMPVITKNKEVREKADKGGGLRYRFAPIDSIVQQVGPVIAQHGFSYTIRVTNDEKMLTAVCIVTHKFGHTEESSFSIPVGTEQYMSDVQKYGARSTFAKRYAFTNAFGIMTGDEDNDSQAKDVPAQPAVNDPERLKKISFMIKQSGLVEKKILGKFKVDSLEQLDDRNLLILEKSLAERIAKNAEIPIIQQ